MTQYICRCGHSSSEKIGERSRFCNACGQQLRVGDFGHSKNIRALVVEDSTLIRRRAKEVLESVGCSVENADNGKKALTMIKINPSDLVISDILMPDMDGLTMLSTLRADMQFKDLPVALLTSEGRGDIIGKAMKLGGAQRYRNARNGRYRTIKNDSPRPKSQRYPSDHIDHAKRR